MDGFFGELRRRKVAKAAALYAVVAWVIIEVSSIVFPALQLPEWTVTFVVLLALIGFPIVLIFSWVFDFTTSGVVRTPTAPVGATSADATVSKGRVIDFVVIAVLAGVIAWLGWERMADRDGPEMPALDSIAVLPFANMSGDPENEYFGDGLAEELLNALVRVDGLRVAARTSSFEYKGQNLDVRRIGEALDVAAVLEGSVRRVGDRVRVTAQLIRAEDGFHLWSETYDRTMDDIFALQDEISLAIVDALRVTLGASEREAVVTHATTNVAALEAYMRGRFEMNKRTGASLRLAVEYFEDAVEADSEYARAYSGLADSWILMSGYAGTAEEESNTRAEEYARRALELDPDLAEANASLGLVLRNQGDVDGSIPLLERATQLNASYSPAFHWLGLSYSQAGRLQDALRVARRAVEIDPQYLTAKRALAGLLRDLGRHDEADAMWARILRDHPADPQVYSGAANDAWQRGERVEAFRRMVRAVELAPQDATLRAGLAQFLVQIGDIERAREQVVLVAQQDPDHSAVRNFPLTIAWATEHPDDAEQAMVVLREWPESMNRDVAMCGFAYSVGNVDLAKDMCTRSLAHFDWVPGSTEPLPAQGTNQTAILMLIAQQEGDTEIEESLANALRAHMATLREAGLDPVEVDWISALIDMLAGEDPAPFLELLPAALDQGNFGPTELRNVWVLRSLHGDPRFEAIVDDQLAQLAAVREVTNSIAIPAP